MISQVYGKRGASALHRFDSRAKTSFLLGFLVLFFLPLRLEHLGAYLAVLVILGGVFLGAANILRPLRMVTPILILVLLLTPPFHRQGTVLIALRGYTILSATGLLLALRLIIRFTGITLVFYLFIGTTELDSDRPVIWNITDIAMSGHPRTMELIHDVLIASASIPVAFPPVIIDVEADGRISPGCAGMYERRHVAAWKRIVDFVHRRSPAKIGIQLAHAGRKGSVSHPWDGDDVPLTAAEGA